MNGPLSDEVTACNRPRTQVRGTLTNLPVAEVAKTFGFPAFPKLLASSATSVIKSTSLAFAEQSVHTRTLRRPQSFEPAFRS